MKLGILVEAVEGLDWNRWRAIYQAAERLGFESVWLSDHLASTWWEIHGLDAWVALSVAAAETSRIRLGPLVSPITFRQPAALVARMAEAIDDLSNGRFVLGLGLGWNAAEHAQFGIPFPPLVERARLLEDGIQRIRDVLGERHIPVVIGGGGARSTLPLVARFANEWNLTTPSLDLYRARSRRLAELCATCGRDPNTIRRSVAVGCLIGADVEDLHARGRRMQEVVQPLAGLPAESIVDAARGMGWVVGTPADIVATLRPLADAGVGVAIIGHYNHTDEAALELLASEVMPALA